MTSSTPLTSSAKKQSVVIQWVTRTMAECRGVTVTTTAEADIGALAESATDEWYQKTRSLSNFALAPYRQ